MAKRKPLSKKIRFEIFKRDHFKCQYCGRHAPDVALEVDHITPVAEGGTNDLENLITSCFDCNRGKGKRKLDDKTVIDKQYDELEKLAIRNEQFEMVLAWKKELKALENRELNYIADMLEVELDYFQQSKLAGILKEFGFEETYEGVEILLRNYASMGIIHFNTTNALKKLGGICYNRRNRRNDCGI